MASVCQKRQAAPFVVVPCSGCLVAGLAAAGAAHLGPLAREALAGAPSILKPLPPSWFIDYGTNAETR